MRPEGQPLVAERNDLCDLSAFLLGFRPPEECCDRQLPFAGLTGVASVIGLLLVPLLLLPLLLLPLLVQHFLLLLLLCCSRCLLGGLLGVDYSSLNGNQQRPLNHKP